MKFGKIRKLDLNDLNNLEDCPKVQIQILKDKLQSTDYQAIKFAEGELSESDYAEVRQLRRNWRALINLLEDIVLNK